MFDVPTHSGQPHAEPKAASPAVAENTCLSHSGVSDRVSDLLLAERPLWEGKQTVRYLGGQMALADVAWRSGLSRKGRS